MVFFIFGYLSFIAITLSKTEFPHEMITSGVFLGGAVFVFIIVNMSKTTILRLRENEKIVSDVNEELKNKNIVLEKEIVRRTHVEGELIKSSEDLRESNREISENRKKLQGAMDEASSLIQNVIREKDLNVRFKNPGLKKCYEVKNCKKDDCNCYGKEAVRCWQIAGTQCVGGAVGAFAQKYGNCSECEVFKDATSDPIYQIGEYFNNLMHVVEIKTGELEGAYRELSYSQAKVVQQEKMATIGQLAAGVAHEINNPTGFISSNLGTLGKYTNKLTEFINAQSDALKFMKSEESLESLKVLRKKLKVDYVLEDLEELIKESLDGADRIKEIVQNLKTFARVDEKAYREADINECIESTLNIVWNELKYKATVEKEYGEIPPTKCYPQQLNQVFMNLLVNAGHAIEKQGVIKIKTWNGGEFINISISNTGQGIPEDKIKKIFEPFFTTKEAGKGTGLGLSISHEIVQKHNGNLSVESEIGKGTTFNIKIPVVEGI
jgi:signal transduction histidine kinase